MTPKWRGTRRGPLDFANPIDVIVDGINWQIRWAGTRIITGVVLIAALVVMSVAFVAPFLPAYLLISVFGLTVEPYKWLGSALILAAFVGGVILATIAVIRLIRRSRRLIALSQFGDDDDVDDPTGVDPSPFVAPAAPSAAEASAARAARIRSLDDRLRPTPDPPPPIDTR
jgi:hypothetical protein